MNLFLIAFVSVVCFSTLPAKCFQMSSEVENHRFKRGVHFNHNDQEKVLNLGTPGPTDTLLLDKHIKREKKIGLVAYDDVAFGLQSYSNTSLVYDCPFVITAVQTIHHGPEETAEYPLVLYGGIGLNEILILFISQRDEGISVTVKIWGKEYENSNKQYNLIEGLPDITDDLLLFTNIFQTSQMSEPVTGSVVYEKPENKNVTITSIQAWDVSTGCKTGGYPSITDGGVGEDSAVIKITSEKSAGFQYHVLVFGKQNKIEKSPSE